jgi:hypothetical protein
MTFKQFYYSIRPLIPRSAQLSIRKLVVHKIRKKANKLWPIDKSCASTPESWGGWSGKKRFAFVLTHDVDTAKGHEFSYSLNRMEANLGFRSSFNFVPERYQVDAKLRKGLVQSGFEVGVHGLNHDGKLYSTRVEFKRRAERINQYLQDWGAVGFRSPAMHHNLEWIHDLNIEYDASTFDTDPFEPQPDGVGTIFPFWVTGDGGAGYVELPYTLPQDFTLFVLMKEKTIDIWKKKLDWIAEHGGMALLNTHPDYMNFDGGKLGVEEYPADLYREFLEYVKTKYEGQYWHALPKEIARFWVSNVVELSKSLKEKIIL